MHLLAWNLNLQGKHAEAEKLSRDEVTMWQTLGSRNDKVARALADLAVFLRDQRRFANAEDAIRQSLSISRKQANKTAATDGLKLLNDLLRRQGRPPE